MDHLNFSYWYHCLSLTLVIISKIIIIIKKLIVIIDLNNNFKKKKKKKKKKNFQLAYKCVSFWTISHNIWEGIGIF